MSMFNYYTILDQKPMLCAIAFKSLSICIIVNSSKDLTVRVSRNILSNVNKDQALLFLQHLDKFPEIQMTRQFVTFKMPVASLYAVFVQSNLLLLLWNIFHSRIGKFGPRRGVFP